MDALIKRFDCIRDDDLMICPGRDIAYQANFKANAVAYDAKYMAKVDAYDGTEIAEKVNAGRVEFLRRYQLIGKSILDIGAGSGAFVRDANRAGFNCKGQDVIPESIERLKAAGVFHDDPHSVHAVCFWDSLEHMPAPAIMLRSVRKGAFCFVSIPCFQDMQKIRDSKHYRPGEHLYYFSNQGFVNYMALYGFRILEVSKHEIEAGREDIYAYAFIKDLPDYHDHVAAYQEMHSTRFYGSSSTELHLDAVAKLVFELRPGSILDYGCGRGDLLAHFWADGRRRLARYDPAIPTYKTMPAGAFDLIFCLDVLEHVPMVSIDIVLDEILRKGKRAIFTISTKPARAKLPDGRNAHVTLLTRSEWRRWLADRFGSIREIPTAWDHELLFLAGA